MHYSFKPTGVCCRQMEMEIANGIVKNVIFTGGCSGNLQGIAALVDGQPAEEIIRRLKGIRCNIKPTSCPDQLAQGLEAYLNENK